MLSVFTPVDAVQNSVVCLFVYVFSHTLSYLKPTISTRNTSYDLLVLSIPFLFKTKSMLLSVDLFVPYSLEVSDKMKAYVLECALYEIGMRVI